MIAPQIAIRDRLTAFVETEEWRAFFVSQNERRLITWTGLRELIELPAPVGLATTPEAFMRALVGKGSARAKRYAADKLRRAPRPVAGGNATQFLQLGEAERAHSAPAKEGGRWLALAQYAIEAGPNRAKPAERYFIPALLEFGKPVPASAMLVRVRRTMYRFDSLEHWLRYRGHGGCQLDGRHLAALGFGDLAAFATKHVPAAPRVLDDRTEPGELLKDACDVLTLEPPAFDWESTERNAA
ncbi:MAG: hypothetical protein R2834_02950 [Rhodothermales bacterium]